MIYSDIIEYNIVVETKSPLLRCILQESTWIISPLQVYSLKNC